MIINENLRCSLALIKEQNEQAYDTIINVFENCPALKHQTVPQCDVFIETVDMFNGKVGTWNISLELDKTHKIDKVRLTFEGALSSRSPYTENLSLVVAGLHMPTEKNANRKIDIANLVLSRVNNYRYATPTLHSLSSKDIKELSKAETVSRFTLNAKLDKENRKFVLTSNERLSDVAQRSEIPTESIEEIQA